MPQLAQHSNQEPARIAARALTEFQCLFRRLHAWLETNDVFDRLVDGAIHVDQKVDRAPLGAIDLLHQLVELWTRRHLGEVRLELVLQHLLVGERRLFRARLQEKIERVIRLEISDQIDRDAEVLGLLREDDARQVVALWVLLPIDEMVGRLNVERVAVDGRAVVRRGPQPNDLRPERDCALVVVAGLVMKRDSDSHDYSDLEKLLVDRSPNFIDRAL